VRTSKQKDDAHLEPPQDREHVFVLRIRVEGYEAPGGQPKFRGSVEYLPTRHSRFFEDFSTLHAFVLHHLGSQDDGGQLRPYDED
jgi:hypothetical protein